jgi:hypothetical protein
MALLTQPVHYVLPDQAAASDDDDLHVALLRSTIQHCVAINAPRMPAARRKDLAAALDFP